MVIIHEPICTQSIAVLIGLVGYLIGLRIDALAAIIVTLFIVFTGIEILQSVVMSQARGEMVRLLKEVEAYKEEKINRSLGEANRFVAILKEYQKAPKVTKDRMYLETMEVIGPRMNKFIISSQLNKNLIKIYGVTE